MTGIGSFYCAINNPIEHISKNPILLSCKHLICKDCFKKIDFENVKCKFCNKECDIDDSVIEESPNFNTIFSERLNELFEKVVQDYKNCLSIYDNLSQTGLDNMNSKIEFIKENIQIRIETIKCELDDVYSLLCDQIDKIGEECKTEYFEIISKFDKEKHENDVSSMLSKISKQEDMTLTDMYKYQDNMIEAFKIIEELNNLEPTFEFIASEASVSQHVVGKISVEPSPEKLIRRIKSGIFKTKPLCTDSCYDICALPNGNLLLSDYEKSKMFVCNDKFELIKAVNKIDGKVIEPIGVDSNGIDRLFIVDYKSQRVIMTDFEFNKLGETGKLGSPHGICHINDVLYVCDYYDSRIEKFNAFDLTTIESFNLDYKPWFIKCSSQVACVRPRSDVAIYFYNLPEFTLKSVFRGHNGLIGIINSSFYEYYPVLKTFYCYNQKGELIEEIKCYNFNYMIRTNESGSIVNHKSKLVISCFDLKSFIII